MGPLVVTLQHSIHHVMTSYVMLPLLYFTYIILVSLTQYNGVPVSETFSKYSGASSWLVLRKLMSAFVIEGSEWEFVVMMYNAACVYYHLVNLLTTLIVAYLKFCSQR